MKVYELMSALEDAPAGMEIRIHSTIASDPSGSLHSVDTDGEDSTGVFSIFFTPDPDET